MVHVRPGDLDAAAAATLRNELAQVYAAAHGSPDAEAHFLENRRLTEFRDLYTARSDGNVLGWFGVNSFELGGRRIETLDDAVVDPRFHRRGITRALTLSIYRSIALRGLRSPSVVAVLTTNPIVAEALESHLRPGVPLYPAMTNRAHRSPRLQALAPSIAARLHPDATFDPDTGVLADFLPRWHLAKGDCSDPFLQAYFDRHLEPGSAILMMFEINRRMIGQHLSVWAKKAAQTTWQRSHDPSRPDR